MSRSAFDFASDNAAIVHPRIFAALAGINTGTASPYGADDVSGTLDALYSRVFERPVFVFPVPTGTAANGLALGAISPSYGAIFSHEKAHIVTTECGAPEFFTTGARLIPMPGSNGKITDSQLSDALAPYRARNVHHLRAAALSLAQATDLGTIYTLDELSTLVRIAHDDGLKVHMDGARFANAMVRLGCTPAQMSWKAGVDILSLGTTKNGTMNVEAVIAFDPDTASILRHLHKRAGFLWSKMRYAAAQLAAYVADDLWIENAHAANATAARLVRAIERCPGASLEYGVDANQIFVHLAPAALSTLTEADIRLRPWPHRQGDLYRIVASFCDSEDLVGRFETALANVR